MSESNQHEGINGTRCWLSILVPIYNASKTLLSTLESISFQLGDGVEVILADDGSKDNSYDLIKTFSARHEPHIIVIKNKKNMGVSATRNVLLDAASGEFLWFVDADDLIMPEAVKSIRNIIADHNPDWINFDYQQVVMNHTNSPSLTNSPNLYVHCLKGVSEGYHQNTLELFKGMFASGKLHLWSRVVKRTSWPKELKFPADDYFEDMAVVPRLAAKTQCFYYARRAFIIYRSHDESIVNSASEKKVLDMNKALNGVLQHWQQQHPAFGVKEEYFYLLNLARVHINSYKMLDAAGRLDKTSRKHLKQSFYRNMAKSKWQVIVFYLKHMQVLRLVRLLKYI